MVQKWQSVILLWVLAIVSIAKTETFPFYHWVNNYNFIVVGPFIDFADGKTTISSLDTADITCWIMREPYMSSSPYYRTPATLKTLNSSNFHQYGNGYAIVQLDVEDCNQIGTLKIAFNNTIVGGVSTETILPFYEQITITAYPRQPLNLGTMHLVKETMIDDDSFTSPTGDVTFGLLSTTNMQVGDYFVYKLFDREMNYHDQWMISEGGYFWNDRRFDWMRKIVAINGNNITLEYGSYPTALQDGKYVGIYRPMPVDLTDESYNDLADVVNDANTAIITKIEDVNTVITAGISALDVDIMGEIQDSNTALMNKITDVNNVLHSGISDVGIDTAKTEIITKINDVNGVLVPKLDSIPKKPSKPSF